MNRLAKQLLLFFLKFIIIYFILMLPPFKKAYSDFYKSQGELWFSKFGEKGEVLFRSPEDKSKKDAMLDVILFNSKSLEAARKAGQAQAQLNDYGTVTVNWYSYMLAAYLIALITAVPISWKRKFFSMFAGMLLAYGYLIFTQWIFLLHWFNEYHTLEVLELEGFSKSFVELVYPLIVINPGTLVFVALLISGIVVLRKSDWVKISQVTTK